MTGMIKLQLNDQLRLALGRYEHMKFTTTLTVKQIAQFCAHLIEIGEQSTSLSNRDGKMLKKIAKRSRLNKEDVVKFIIEICCLYQSINNFIEQIIVKMLRRYEEGTSQNLIPKKWQMYIIRAVAYYASGDIKQAYSDAKHGLSFGPGDSVGIASFVVGIVLAKLNKFEEAAIYLIKAVQCQSSNEEYQKELENIKRFLQPSALFALNQGGSNGLQQWIEEEKERALPPFLRKTEKYFYYNQWMTDRIRNAIQYELPQAVIDKLLCMDASELDLLIQNSIGIKTYAHKMLEIYHDKGQVIFQEMKVPQLTWQEVKQFTGSKTTGIGLNNHVLEDGQQQLSIEQGNANINIEQFEDLDELN
eukprot:TRINITY_DN12087_c0_g4_i1.p1 TRINITY_DN12087_c0_g4~~TRINITY_DN12087_c0_g4_i1.p1  ORF type:complete len:381 (-),score=31.09 TRINITY_DN12087_c0_g4_i1:225-1304(-)